MTFIIPGNPVAQGRAKFGQWKSKDGRSGVTARDPEKSRNWKSDAAALIRFETGGVLIFPDDASVKVVITAIFPFPASASRKRNPPGRCWYHGRKDVDNIAKAVLDAMTRAGVWVDDDQVADLRVVKVRAAQGEAPSVEIDVSPAGDPEIESRRDS